MRPARAIAVYAALLIGGASCSSDARTAPSPADAAVPAPVPAIDAALVLEPAATDDAGHRSRPTPRRQPKPETIQIVLRSSPPGAIASVDGIIIGTTPTYWQGAKTTSPREFTFVRTGYAMARYRFVPIKGGVVHATLKPVIHGSDAGPD